MTDHSGEANEPQEQSPTTSSSSSGEGRAGQPQREPGATGAAGAAGGAASDAAGRFDSGAGESSASDSHAGAQADASAHSPSDAGGSKVGASNAEGAGSGSGGAAESDGGASEPGSADGAPDGRRKRRRRRRRKPAAGGDADSTADRGGESAVAAKPEDGARRPAGKKGRDRNPSRGDQHSKGRKAKKPGRRSGREPHHALVAIESLGEMVRDLLQVEGIDLLDMPRFVDVKLQIPLDVKRDGKNAASKAVEQILNRVKEVREHEAAIQPGSVYCYFHESAEGESSRPPGMRDVFDGYESTGRPIFTDFVTMSIERKHDGIDALLAGEDIVLTHIALGRVLRTQQLAVFGKASPVYRILGQVDAGLFRLLNSPKQAAFSFQLLRGTTLEGKPRLRLHPVGAADLMDLADPSIVQILHRFQQRLNTESLRLAGKLSNDAEFDEEEFALPLLQELAKQLSGRHKRRSRRTAHADERSAESQRPTTKAYADADHAGDTNLFVDEFEGTIVVLGPRGRIHVFTNQAKHVTSMVMNTQSVGQRQRQGRWRKAEPEERGEFRIALRRAIQRGDQPADTSVSATPPVPSVGLNPRLAATPPETAAKPAAEPAADAAGGPAAGSAVDPKTAADGKPAGTDTPSDATHGGPSAEAGESEPRDDASSGSAN